MLKNYPLNVDCCSAWSKTIFVQSQKQIRDTFCTFFFMNKLDGYTIRSKHDLDPFELLNSYYTKKVDSQFLRFYWGVLHILFTSGCLTNCPFWIDQLLLAYIYSVKYLYKAMKLREENWPPPHPRKMKNKTLTHFAPLWSNPTSPPYAQQEF